MSVGIPRFLTVLVVAATAGFGCDQNLPGASTGPEPSEPALECTLDLAFLESGGVSRDGIPSLDNPSLADQGTPAALQYLAQDDRVIGFFLDGVPVAVPHNILWHHEIVNLTGQATDVAVTYCPLTGTGLVFDRSPVGGAEFGVSGLLYQSNLIMYDRRDESLWPQMFAQGRCGPQTGVAIPQVAAWEMTWGAWQLANPQTKVVGDDTGYDRDYTTEGFPYGNYEEHNTSYWFRMPSPDPRLRLKERVLGIPSIEGSTPLVFPFLELNKVGDRVVIEATLDNGVEIFVLWERGAQGATVFRAGIDGEPVRLTTTPSGFVTDDGSRFALDGVAKAGPRLGQQLTPIPQAYVSFWGAWAAFHPETDVWTRR